MKLILIFFALFSSLISMPLVAMAETGAPRIHIPQGDFSDLREAKADKVIKIIDPLVIELERHGLVHLIGLDIPDYNPYEQGALAESSIKILNDMLIDQNVRLYQTRDRNEGRNNRMRHQLMHVVMDKNGSWVQGVMVQLGLARVRSDKSNPEAIRDLYKIEAIARKEKLGLWAFEQYQVLADTDAEKHINSFQIVEGTVNSAARKQNNIFLNFGNDWRKDFTVSIKPSEITNFSKAGMNPLDLNGKKIRVRGWIREYNGAFMEIDHPERIEILSE